MLKRLPVAVFCLLACGALASLSPPWPGAFSHTEDRNGDGRPDVWRTYDREGQVSEVAIDTNFDGRSDVHEHYERGALVSREVDRNFDDRIDLIQEFDPETHDQVRSVEDVDYDGAADVLVLFEDGKPIFRKWASRPGHAGAVSSSPTHPNIRARAADDPLTPLTDPFQAELAVRAVRTVTGSGAGVGLSTSGGMPAPGLDDLCPLLSAPLHQRDHRQPQSATLDLPFSRGPPVSS